MSFKGVDKGRGTCFIPPAPPAPESRGVMATLLILVQAFKVRVLAGLPIALPQLPHFSGSNLE